MSIVGNGSGCCHIKGCLAVISHGKRVKTFAIERGYLAVIGPGKETGCHRKSIRTSVMRKLAGIRIRRISIRITIFYIEFKTMNTS